MAATERSTLEQAILHLADRWVERDVEYGAALVAWIRHGRQLSTAQKQRVLQMLAKYRAELLLAGIDYDAATKFIQGDRGTVATYGGTCVGCRKHFPQGTRIQFVEIGGRKRTCHLDCVVITDVPDSSEKAAYPEGALAHLEAIRQDPRQWINPRWSAVLEFLEAQ